MAEQLRAALEQRGFAAKIINMQAGGDIDTAVFQWIEHCETFVVFGSAKYGEDTGNQACTCYEYKHAFALKKRIILIRLIPFEQEFEELQARVIFNANKLIIPWMGAAPIPRDLPEQIVQAIRAPPEEAFPPSAQPTVLAAAAGTVAPQADAAANTENPLHGSSAAVDGGGVHRHLPPQQQLAAPLAKPAQERKRKWLVGLVLLAAVLFFLVGASLRSTGQADSPASEVLGERQASGEATGDSTTTSNAGVDPCFGIACGPHGACSLGRCLCDVGHTRQQCESVDQCFGVDCGVHGRCNDAGGYSCSLGYSGGLCQIFDPCVGVDCGDFGRCRDGACLCIGGYSGALCKDYDACYRVSCGDHGAC